jgi:ribosomal protein S18 acetylase RimI-like enzyme
VTGVPVEVQRRQDPAAVERLLRELPNWFGIAESNRAYVDDAERLPSYLAVGPDDQVVGALLLKRHFPEAAEVHLMAVDPRLHRQAVGRLLLEAVEADLAADDVRLLQVKTVGPSSPDLGYAKTRAFYSAMGFLPLEEFPTLWNEANPCLVLVKPLARTAAR